MELKLVYTGTGLIEIQDLSIAIKVLLSFACKPNQGLAQNRNTQKFWATNQRLGPKCWPVCMN